jgi:hypothetical protein
MGWTDEICDNSRDCPHCIELRLMNPRLSWEYLGEELAIFWVNPWSSEKEKIASFWWPTHPVEATADVEAAFEKIAARLTVADGR